MSERADLPASALLVGCGRMGGALLAGWRNHLPVFVLDPRAPASIDAPRLDDASEVLGLPKPLFILLAVKPDMIPKVLRTFAPVADRDTLFVSVAAGIGLQSLQGRLGPEARVARAMPNIAAAKRAGATALCFGANLDDTQKKYCRTLFGLVGEVFAVDSDSLIDVSTAIAGSGPAYFFRFAEALADAGRGAGLSEADASRLSAATLHGAGALVDGTATLSELRTAVTSPGGTTAAALDALNSGGAIDNLAAAAVAAAIRRSRELAG